MKYVDECFATLPGSSICPDGWSLIYLSVHRYPLKSITSNLTRRGEGSSQSTEDGVDNIPAELVQEGGEAMIDVLTSICNKSLKTGEWLATWTQSLVISFPKKGNLQLCQNYRIISPISHHSMVNMKIILNRLQSQAKKLCRRASLFPSGKEHHRANIQSPREIPATSTEPLPCIHRFQEGL